MGRRVLLLSRLNSISMIDRSNGYEDISVEFLARRGQAKTPYWRALQELWRRGRDSNPPLNGSSTTYRATDGVFRRFRHCKTVAMAGERQVDSSGDSVASEQRGVRSRF